MSMKFTKYMKEQDIPFDKLIKKEENYFICNVAFSTISTKIYNNPIFQTPIFQTELQPEKVTSMITSYLENPHFWVCKKAIVLAYFISQDKEQYNIYLLDGQHRLKMACDLYKNNNISSYLEFYYYEVKTNEELQKLFTNINMDSYKNQYYVSIPELEKSKYNILKESLQNYKSFFSKTNSEKSKIFSIDDFIKKIFDEKIKDDQGETPSIEYFIEKNREFNSFVGYQSIFLTNRDLFYKEDQDILEKENFLTFAFKNNNFLNYLKNPQKIIPEHVNFKHKKDKISPKLRQLVWNKEFGDNVFAAKCPINKCINEIYINEKNGFHCGHVVSFYNNGKTEIDNLRPICASCNSHMSTKNWEEFDT